MDNKGSAMDDESIVQDDESEDDESEDDESEDYEFIPYTTTLHTLHPEIGYLHQLPSLRDYEHQLQLEINKDEDLSNDEVNPIAEKNEN